MDKEQIKDLLERYQTKQCTAEERSFVEQWYRKEAMQQEQSSEDIDYEYWKQRIAEKLPIIKPRTINWPLRIAFTAAAVVILLGIWTVIFVKTPLSKDYANDIDPGSNKAVLTLGNGQKIVLTDAKNGELIKESGIEVTKTEDGKVIYKTSNSTAKGSENTYNLISTPKGGQYQIILPDGTKVWLNAASHLKFPTTFTGLVNRRVELSGEAYFEVSKDKSHPFLVVSNKQTVEVLGTHFNINSYADDPNTKTTLLEGSVSVTSTTPRHLDASPSSGTLTSSRGKRSDERSLAYTTPIDLSSRQDDGKVRNDEQVKQFDGLGEKTIILKPNQQSVINSGTAIKVTQIDPEEAVAWKNGKFTFNKESLESIMKKLARWYDVEVIFQNKELGEQIFGGTISRYSKISEVLCVLERTGDVKFKIEGRRVLITN
nr:FecR family protein [Pedobacter panaciterrae]